MSFKLPANDGGKEAWSRLLDSSDQTLISGSVSGTYKLEARSVAVLADLSSRRLPES